MNQKSSLGVAGALLLLIPNILNFILQILSICKVEIINYGYGGGIISIEVWNIINLLFITCSMVGCILLLCYFNSLKSSSMPKQQAYPQQGAYYQQQAMQHAYQQQQQAYQQQQQAYQQAQQAQQQAQQAYAQQAANPQQGQGYYGYNQANYNQPK